MASNGMDWRSVPSAQAAVILYIILDNINEAVKERNGTGIPMAEQALADALDLWPALRHEAASSRSAAHGWAAARKVVDP